MDGSTGTQRYLRIILGGSWLFCNLVTSSYISTNHSAISSTSSLHLRSRATLLTKKFVCWGRQGQKHRGNGIFSNPDGESAKSGRSTSDVEYSDNHWCILWFKKKKKKISVVSIIELGNDAAVMLSSSRRSSYCWKMYFCATLISSCDRILTENNKKAMTIYYSVSFVDAYPHSAAPLEML